MPTLMIQKVWRIRYHDIEQSLSGVVRFFTTKTGREGGGVFCTLRPMAKKRIMADNARGYCGHILEHPYIRINTIGSLHLAD